MWVSSEWLSDASLRSLLRGGELWGVFLRGGERECCWCVQALLAPSGSSPPPPGLAGPIPELALGGPWKMSQCGFNAEHGWIRAPSNCQRKYERRESAQNSPPKKLVSSKNPNRRKKKSLDARTCLAQSGQAASKYSSCKMLGVKKRQWWTQMYSFSTPF